MVDAEEKIRRKAREFVNQQFEGLTDAEREQAEEEVVELIKDGVHATMQSKEVKDLEAAGEEFDLEIHLSLVDQGKSNGNEVNGNGRVR